MPSDRPTAHRRLITEPLPSALVETAKKRCFESIPATYPKQIIASVLASGIVYREGLDWFEQTPKPDIAGYLSD